MNGGYNALFLHHPIIIVIYVALGFSFGQIVLKFLFNLVRLVGFNTVVKIKRIIIRIFIIYTLRRIKSNAA